MISIIIPTLNEEDYLPFLLESIKRQNFNNYEIIVADNNSKDRTVEIAKSFGCRIAGGGLPGKGRNEGAKIAKGKVFLFLDADNFCSSRDFLGKLIFGFKKKKLGVASFPLFLAGNNFDKFAYLIYNYWVRLTQKFLPYATNAILVKREIFEKIKGFDEAVTMGEDHEFVRRASKVGKFGFVNTEPLLTSCRRFEADGRLKTYPKFLIANFHMLFAPKIRSDIYRYHFNKYSKK